MSYNSYTKRDLLIVPDLIGGSEIDFSLRSTVTIYEEESELNIAFSRFIDKFYEGRDIRIPLLILIFIDSFEEMPLYINDPSEDMRFWAGWRLKIGK